MAKVRHSSTDAIRTVALIKIGMPMAESLQKTGKKFMKKFNKAVDNADDATILAMGITPVMDALGGAIGTMLGEGASD